MRKKDLTMEDWLNATGEDDIDLSINKDDFIKIFQKMRPSPRYTSNEVILTEQQLSEFATKCYNKGKEVERMEEIRRSSTAYQAGQARKAFVDLFEVLVEESGLNKLINWLNKFLKKG